MAGEDQNNKKRDPIIAMYAGGTSQSLKRDMSRSQYIDVSHAHFRSEQLLIRTEEAQVSYSHRRTSANANA